MDDFMKISVKLNGKLYTGDIAEQLRISEETINQDLAEQPSKYAWWAVLTSLAKERMNQKKMKLEQLESKLYFDYIPKLAGSSGRKPSDESLKRAIQLDATYQKAKQEYLSAAHDYDLLVSATRAFEQRKDALISLASLMRVEMDVNLRTVEGKARENIRKSRRAK